MNLNSRRFADSVKLKNMFRIPMVKIRISILEGLLEDKDLNLTWIRFESRFHKVCSDKKIRISLIQIRILPKKDSTPFEYFQAEVKEEENGLKSPLRGVESRIWRNEKHMKDLNPYKKDSNPF